MKKFLLPSLISATSLLFVPSEANALNFKLNLDATFDNTLTEPFVITGNFSFDGDPGDGTFALESLSNFDFNFSLPNGSTLTNTNIITPVEEVLIIISSTETNRRVQFSNVNPFGSTILEGSIDFADFNNPTFLTFEPPGNEGNLNLYAALANNNVISGTYEGVAVPEFNSTLSLLSFGALGIGLTIFKNQKLKN